MKVKKSLLIALNTVCYFCCSSLGFGRVFGAATTTLKTSLEQSSGYLRSFPPLMRVRQGLFYGLCLRLYFLWGLSRNNLTTVSKNVELELKLNVETRVKFRHVSLFTTENNKNRTSELFRQSMQLILLNDLIELTLFL